MSKTATGTIDGSEAAARVAYALSDVIAIYPITPATAMGEAADLWAGARRPNLWGTVPRVIELQSEAGAIGTMHGALTAGSLGTTFTASQGLLLMIPALYKIVGELSPFVVHVAARAVATHALSIFGDHSDVMAARSTGAAMLCAGSVQEAMDFALVAHSAALESRIPFLHFFDGFRTSHEIQRVSLLQDDDLRALISEERVLEHRRRALTPEHPATRGTSQNPDVFFQSREAANSFYAACPAAVEKAFDALAARTGRRYGLFDYAGHPEADRVIVMMGSGAEAAETAVERLSARGERVGLVKVRLFRPFSIERFVAALPQTTRRIAVLDRTKEPGAPGEPLYLDVVAALARRPAGAAGVPSVVGGRYGLGSKEFTPAMAMAVLRELEVDRPRHPFTIGIRDDLSGTSLEWDPAADAEEPGTFSALFYGLGSDGTVGANKTSATLIAEDPDRHAQAYFVYDSKKSGGVTVTHLRFGPKPIRAPYLISSADFVACHQESLLERVDVPRAARRGATLLLNAADPERLWDRLPREVQQTVADKGLRVFAVDAHRIAADAGLGSRINTVMQACFFSIAGVLPDFLDKLKGAARKAYAKKGEGAVAANLKALDMALSGLREVRVPPGPATGRPRRSPVPASAPEFVRNVTGPLLAGEGDSLPVSAMPADGAWPVGTTRWEKRALAREIPAWEEGLCIQCNKCALVCPHAAVRVKAYAPEAAGKAPAGFLRMAWKGREFPSGTLYTVQVAPEDCTGCNLCVEVCPGESKTGPERRALAMVATQPRLEAERRNFEFFLGLPEAEVPLDAKMDVKRSQLKTPLFEFSGACAGCGETPYVKLLTQLFGERMVVANATGCSSIFGGNLPTSPWCIGASGRGPAWSNSLFENNAEFGLGFRLAFDRQAEYACELLEAHKAEVGEELAAELSVPDAGSEAASAGRRKAIAALKAKLDGRTQAWARDLASLADGLSRRSVWIVGGDGWAYDIGFGGLDHVLRSGEKVNMLVLDTEVYSNTGGQASKATPRGAIAKFAATGKAYQRKDLVLEALAYGGAYVARVALGVGDAQAVQALLEADAYPGPSLIVAYSTCIAHGIDMAQGLEQQRLAVKSGYWPLLRFDPRRRGQGLAPLRLDSGPPQIPFREYALRENRYRRLLDTHPEEAERLLALAQEDIERRWRLLQRLGEGHVQS